MAIAYLVKYWGDNKLRLHQAKKTFITNCKLYAKNYFGDQNNLIFLGKMRNSRYYIIVNVPSSVLSYPIYVAKLEVKIS
jgi:hypothetical protein